MIIPLHLQLQLLNVIQFLFQLVGIIQKKAEILLENLNRFKSTDNYSDVFVKPAVQWPLQRDNEIITAEDDQKFLARLQLTLNRAGSPGRGDENVTPMHTRSQSGGPGSQTHSVSGRQTKPLNINPSDPNRAINEGPLAKFFTGLLQRKSVGPVTPTSPSTPPTLQRQNTDNSDVDSTDFKGT